MNAKAIVTIATLVCLLTLSGCYLFNSKTASPDPDEIMRRRNVFNARGEVETVFRIWVFAATEQTRGGADVFTDGYFKTIKLRIGGGK